MKQKIFFFFLNFMAVASYGQVTLVPVIEGEDFKVNQRFNITYVLEIKGDSYIQETPLQLPDFSKFNMIGTASDQKTYADPKKNFIINQIIYQVVLEPKQSGTIKIGSARVIVNGEIYRTEPFDIYISPAEKTAVAVTKPADDIYLNLEIEDRVVYKNQPTIAVLKAYSKNFDNFRKVKNIQTPQQHNVNFKTVSNRKSEIETTGNLSSQVIAVYMIFPKESGKVSVKSVSAMIKNTVSENKILSNKVNLNVKDLPKEAPESFRNAVGNFKVQLINRSEGKVETDKPINVTVRLSGEGNLGNIKLPAILESDHYKVFPSKIINHIKTGKTGMKGEVLANYIIVPQKPGSISIQTDEFSFFDPSEKKYVSLPPQTIEISAFTHAEILDDQTTLEKVNNYTNTVLETVNSPVIHTSKLKVKENAGINWNAVLLNFGVFFGVVLLGFLYRRHQRKQKALVMQKVSMKAKASGSVADRENEIRSQQNVELSAYFIYLEKQLKNREWEGFFKTFEEMKLEVRKSFSAENESEFRNILERERGPKITEEYRNLIQRIQIERFAPLHLEENIIEIYDQTVELYSQISK
ncbi:BatD family protein [Chryseobacterium sp.]|uniref:BatD family protein n=1 Tax=Chryseobacterium sp. TaxID=1871047 RepID=UPI0011CAE66D|nr:BatD family protein [Chryseobacterium sp.]TXF79338.1 protein BatD [Chryseobacterium sp.]